MSLSRLERQDGKVVLPICMMMKGLLLVERDSNVYTVLLEYNGRTDCILTRLNGENKEGAIL